MSRDVIRSAPSCRSLQVHNQHDLLPPNRRCGGSKSAFVGLGPPDPNTCNFANISYPACDYQSDSAIFEFPGRMQFQGLLVFIRQSSGSAFGKTKSKEPLRNTGLFLTCKVPLDNILKLGPRELTDLISVVWENVMQCLTARSRSSMKEDIFLSGSLE
ncbi:MAG: hypothetical protein CM1200mP39_19740 [Dehalococcoidia bacterium]|nr:MAG: hypothetical protein CM1200mP39_19740 [Dehalococcoidia bacterium]